MPWDTGAGFANRAWLLLPDGRAIAQDKLCLTPGEQDAASWDLVPGDTLQVVEWEGLTVVILICLDVEMPALALPLAPLDPARIMVPTMTATPSGSSRVFPSATARTTKRPRSDPPSGG